jgi:hypothetical protein
MIRFIATLSVFTLLFSYQHALACSCRTGGYWVSEFLEDKTVFEGQVLQTKWIKPGSTEFGFGNNAETKFEVSSSYKGKLHSTPKIKHHSQGPACGMFYIMGSEVIVTAYTNSAGELTTNSCTSNAVPVSTLMDYFEKGLDTYIPSHWDCTLETKSDKDDPKNCYFWSDEAAQERQKNERERWRKKRVLASEKNKE